jgi:hypothetical protein
MTVKKYIKTKFHTHKTPKLSAQCPTKQGDHEGNRQCHSDFNAWSMTDKAGDDEGNLQWQW